eukprot:COSAG02_NODE_4733_length_5040_cov_3.321392_5_plen_157_part_00
MQTLLFRSLETRTVCLTRELAPKATISEICLHNSRLLAHSYCRYCFSVSLTCSGLAAAPSENNGSGRDRISGACCDHIIVGADQRRTRLPKVQSMAGRQTSAHGVANSPFRTLRPVGLRRRRLATARTPETARANETLGAPVHQRKMCSILLSFRW